MQEILLILEIATIGNSLVWTGGGLGTYVTLSVIISIVGVITILACGGANILKPIIHLMPMPGVKCPTCASRGIEQWVLPGKHCPNCSTACRNICDEILTLIYLSIYGYISMITLITIISAILE
jgi:hypothetical protein